MIRFTMHQHGPTPQLAAPITTKALCRPQQLIRPIVQTLTPGYRRTDRRDHDITLQFFYLQRTPKPGTALQRRHTHKHITAFISRTVATTCFHITNFRIMPVQCVCVYVSVCTHIHTYIHTHIHQYTHINTYIHTHTYIHTYTHTYVHTYTHTYIHTYIHNT